MSVVDPHPHAVAAVHAEASPSYVDWRSILAGAVLAAAVSFVLLTFGSAIGLTAVSAEPGEGVSLAWITIASGIWFVWVTVSSFAAGGYLAGRMRVPFLGATEDEVETRDGAHGLLVWATAAVVGAVLAASGITGLAGSAASGVGAAAGGVTEAATQAVGGDVDYLGGRLMRGGDAAAQGGAGEAAAILTRSLSDGELSQEDRDYLAGLVASRTGQTPEEANAAVDAAAAEARRLYEAALETAERARTVAAIAAFVVAATMMASAAAAYFAAIAGGNHRDDAVPFRTFGRG
jgi:hypothetical protein